eukprot:TRINITY_DN2478_c0_g1_i1.p1 TRINITY_DN2478_c0_g1~~TRINITY_DN2478_c0_g1_i1.p1  ORF type:complete len:554 (+),score=211.15 TRINITY_DN2478_c0_g1_i1:55-1716(+)
MASAGGLSPLSPLELSEMQRVEDEVRELMRRKAAEKRRQEQIHRELDKAGEEVLAAMQRQADAEQAEKEARDMREQAMRSLDEAEAVMRADITKRRSAARRDSDFEGLHATLSEPGMMQALEKRLAEQERVEKMRTDLDLVCEAIQKAGSAPSAPGTTLEQDIAVVNAALDGLQQPEPVPAPPADDPSYVDALAELDRVARALTGDPQDGVGRRRDEADAALQQATQAVAAALNGDPNSTAAAVRAAQPPATSVAPAQAAAPVPTPDATKQLAPPGGDSGAEGSGSEALSRRAEEAGRLAQQQSVPAEPPVTAPAAPLVLTGVDELAASTVMHFLHASGLQRLVRLRRTETVDAPELHVRSGASVSVVGAMNVCRTLASHYPRHTAHLYPFHPPEAFGAVDEAAEAAVRVSLAVTGVLAALQVKRGFVGGWIKPPQRDVEEAVRRLWTALQYVDGKFYRNGADWAAEGYLCTKDMPTLGDIVLASALQALHSRGVDAAALRCRRTAEAFRRIRRERTFVAAHSVLPNLDTEDLVAKRQQRERLHKAIDAVVGP